MIKIIPHASNNITIELNNGDRFEIITDETHLDISMYHGNMVVSKYDFDNMEYNTVMTEHTIRIIKD